MRVPGLWRSKMLLNTLRRKARSRRALTALKNFPRIIEKRMHGLDRPLVVTLTSYPLRFPHLGKTLRSLLDQTIAADRVILWLAHTDIGALPDDVRALEAHGLEIRGCDDLRSYKKLIPALRENPDRYFVIADDDVYYPSYWLQELVRASRKNPGDVIAWRARFANMTASGRFEPYRNWKMADPKARPDQRVFPTGMGGVLYPPGAFDARVTDEDLFLELAPHGDDIWFYWMSRLAGRNHRVVRQSLDFVEWPTSQSSGLFQDNLLGDGNDRQLAAMETHFGAVP